MLAELVCLEACLLGLWLTVSYLCHHVGFPVCVLMSSSQEDTSQIGILTQHLFQGPVSN